LGKPAGHVGIGGHQEFLLSQTEQIILAYQGRMVAAASATLDPVLRMQRLSQCEARLLRTMPFIPLYFDAWIIWSAPKCAACA
jgi:hypothetical protein